MRAKNGFERFVFARDPVGKTPVEQIPPGYEIRENVNGQVTLGKKRPSLIRPEELAAVETAISRLPEAENFRAGVKGRHILVYERMGPDLEALFEMLEKAFPVSKSRLETLREQEKERGRFNPVLRFKLEDRQARGFSAERMTYSGHDDWGGPAHWGSIHELANGLIPLPGLG